MANFLTKIFGTHSSHELKKIYPKPKQRHLLKLRR